MGRKVITVWLVLLASLGITWAADQYGKGGVEHLYWGGSHSQIRYYTGDTLTISGLVPIDVRAWGATGDGSTDDQDSLQVLIDSVGAWGGGEIYFPFTADGYVTDEITIADADIRLIGPSIPDSMAGGAPRLLYGAATPEGAVWGPVGSIYQRNDGVADSVAYAKTTGTGETGWVPLMHNDGYISIDTLVFSAQDTSAMTGTLGKMMFSTTDSILYIWNGASWEAITSGP